ncbi:MAG: hypothetical protein LBE35_02825 [Clostridiales bacterium]|jgi:spore germination protein YaaH|nr:hypothetical protein [Clostridiales bacterium]
MTNKTKLIIIAALVAIVLGLVAFLVFSLFFRGGGETGADEEAGDNMDEVGFFDFFEHFDPARILVAMGEEYIIPPTAIRFIDDRLYLPADFLREHVDRHIFWEAENQRLTISDFEEIARFTPDSEFYTVNWQERALEWPIRQINDMAFIAADMVMARYPLRLDFQGEYNILILEFDKNQKLIYRAEFEESEEEAEEQWLPLRFGASSRQPIKARIEPGEQVVFLANHGEFYHVRLANGLMGFAPAENLVLDDYIAGVPQVELRRPITRPGFDGAINMVWHQLTNHAAALNEEAWYAPHGVNVISPTWFTFSREAYDGTIISLANHVYVEWAHRNGMEVWPKIADAFFGETFSNEAAQLILMDAEIRDYIIRQIMDLVARYNLDGINVDYEQVFPPEGAHFIQFLRELSVPMRAAGAVLSVAVYPPVAFNLWWNYPEIGKAVDFITMMTYDEHWTTSVEAGSVASFPWVQYAVETLVSMVPPEQIVMGLPTYVRIWTEEFNANSGEWELISWDEHMNPHHRTRAVGMNWARSFIRDLGAEFIWDYILRQYYGVYYFEHDGGERRHRVWLSDLRSTGEKLGLYARHDLAGVAWWRKGLEDPALWDFVDNVLN